jgi:anti-sigma factor RsiW
MPTAKATTPAQIVLEHHLEWNDRLQDWLDGDVEASDGSAFETHFAGCPHCQQRVAEMRKLDATLLADTPTLSLDSSFDARLLAQIESINEVQRAAARARVEEELRENLRALSHSWKRMLAFMVPGIIGGIALAFTVAGFFDASGITAKLAVEGASALGGNAALVHTVLTGLLGAAVGGVMAGWLARAAE